MRKLSQRSFGLVGLLILSGCGRDSLPEVAAPPPSAVAPAPNASGVPLSSPRPPSSPEPVPAPAPVPDVVAPATEVSAPNLLATNLDFDVDFAMPDELPVYVDAETVQTMATPQGTFAMLSTPDDPHRVMEFYAARLAADGWRTVVSLTNDENVITTYLRDSRTMSVILSHPEDVTLISITLSNPRPSP